MARKKKNVTIEAAQTDKIDYKGSIKVSILKGDVVYKQKTFINHGRWPLYKFFTYSLNGNYNDAEQWRPLFVDIYSIPYSYVKDTTGGIPDIKSTSTNHDDKQTDQEWKNLSSGEIRKYTQARFSKTATFGTLMERPTIETKEYDGLGSSKIVYKFLIPFSSLILTKTDHTDQNSWYNHGSYEVEPINIVCLYSKQNEYKGETNTQSITCGNPSAYFFVPDENNSSKLGSLLPKNMLSAAGDYSLVIEWTLNFNVNND